MNIFGKEIERYVNKLQSKDTKLKVNACPHC